jgi:hypothetical protein
MQLLDKVNIIYTEYIPGTAGDFFSQYTAGCSDKIIGFNKILDSPNLEYIVGDKDGLSTCKGVNFPDKDLVDYALNTNLVDLKSLFATFLLWNVRYKTNIKEDDFLPYINSKTIYFTNHPRQTWPTETRCKVFEKKLKPNDITITYGTTLQKIILVPSNFHSFLFMCTWRVFQNKKHWNGDYESVKQICKNNCESLLRELYEWVNGINFKVTYVDPIQTNNIRSITKELKFLFGNTDKILASKIIKYYTEKRINPSLELIKPYKEVVQELWNSSVYVNNMLPLLKIIC